MSWYRVRNYNLELESSLWGIDDDVDRRYSVEFDGLVTNREQIKVLADLIRQLHSSLCPLSFASLRYGKE